MSATETTAAVFEDAFARALFDARAPGPSELARMPAFAVYRNTTMKGCVDSLRANYPSVARLVGEAWFEAAALRFARDFPPSTPVLLTYGADFETFLAGFEPAGELPYLAGVAALDRLWTECHVAADADPLAGSAVALLPPQVLAASVLHPHPAARWRYFDAHPILSIWSANRQGETQDELEMQWIGEGALLTRPGDHVRWRAVDAALCAFLDSCVAGANVGEALRACLEVNPNTDVSKLMAILIKQGALYAITTPTLPLEEDNQ